MWGFSPHPTEEPFEKGSSASPKLFMDFGMEVYGNVRLSIQVISLEMVEPKT